MNDTRHTEMLHTPGPWHTAGTFDPDADPRQNIWSEAPHGAVSGELIARYAKPANARLICAAPDLLAALQLVVDTYGFDPSIDSAIWQTAFAALKKAGHRTDEERS